MRLKNPGDYAPWLMLGLILVVLSGYAMPWLVNPGVALSLNAYDLAEWSTLHPPVPDRVSPLQSAFLLRLPVAITAWITVLLFFRWQIGQRSDSIRAIWIILIMLIILATFPPLEIITERDNTNYQQQSFVFVASLLGCIAVYFWTPIRSYSRFLIPVLAIIALIISLAGLAQAQTLMVGFSMPVAIGIGPGSFTIALLAIAGANINKKDG